MPDFTLGPLDIEDEESDSDSEYDSESGSHSDWERKHEGQRGGDGSAA